MAINQQFSDIVKSHPELLKQAQQAMSQQEKPATEMKVNPFSRFKQNGTPQPAKPVAPVFPTAGTPFGKPKTTPQPVVVNEDNEDDDPALIAVADKPYESKVDQTVKFKKGEKNETKKVEETVTEKKEETVPTQKEESKAIEEKKEEPSKDLVDIIPEEDKDPDYFKNKVEAFRQRYVHEEFAKYQEEIFKRLEAIKITADLNTGTVKVRLADIAALRLEIFKHRVDIKMLAQCPLDKEHGDIYASAKIQAKGSNETERKSSYFQYLKNFPVKDSTVDIPFLTTVLDMYNIFFDAVLAELKVRQDILVTYTVNLKIDAAIS